MSVVGCGAWGVEVRVDDVGFQAREREREREREKDRARQRESERAREGVPRRPAE